MTDTWHARLRYTCLMAEMVSGQRIPEAHSALISWHSTLNRALFTRTVGFTQKDHEAILDRPRVVEP